MEKTIGAKEARRNFDKILQDITVQGDTFIVELQGEHIAAMVPLEVYEQWKRSRAQFFAKLRNAQARADMTPEEAETLAKEAVQGVREYQETQVVSPAELLKILEQGTPSG